MAKFQIGELVKIKTTGETGIIQDYDRDSGANPIYVVIIPQVNMVNGVSFYSERQQEETFAEYAIESVHESLKRQFDDKLYEYELEQEFRKREREKQSKLEDFGNEIPKGTIIN